MVTCFWVEYVGRARLPYRRRSVQKGDQLNRPAGSSPSLSTVVLSLRKCSSLKSTFREATLSGNGGLQQ